MININIKKINRLLILSLCFLLMTSCSITEGSVKLGENKLIEEIISPSGHYKVLVFERNVGATADYSYHISILNHNDELRNSDIGNVLVSSEQAEISWLDDTKIAITLCGDNKIFKQVDEFDKIKIDYLSK